MALSAPQGGHIKRALTCLSLANLVFINDWTQILILVSPRFAYYRTGPPDWRMLGALILDTLVLGGFTFVAASATRSSNLWPKRAGLLFLGLVSLFAINNLVGLAGDAVLRRIPGLPTIWLETGLVVAALLFVFIRPTLAIASWITALLIVSPLFFIFAGNAARLCHFSVLKTEGRGGEAGMLPHHRSAKTRVIWVIFDELDKTLVFDRRPARVRMPEFDRLRGESFEGANALPSGPETLLAMPSLICGRRVADVKLSADDLKLKFADSSGWVSWRQQPNIFSRARGSGFDTALSGWYNPYCRILGNDLSSCAWDGSGQFAAYFAEEFLRPSGIFKHGQYLADWQLRNAPFLANLGVVRPQPDQLFLSKSRQIAEYSYILEHALRQLQNRDLDILLFHFPVPHPTGFWNSEQHTFSLSESSDYFDNLQLADRTLGQIRGTLQAAGDWDRSAVLVSADHPFRAARWKGFAFEWSKELEIATRDVPLHYVPFFLKLPGQHQRFKYLPEFNSVTSQALLLQVLHGGIAAPEAVSAWLASQQLQANSFPGDHRFTY